MKQTDPDPDRLLLRPMADADHEALRSLTLAAIQVTAADYYDAAQLAAWASWADDATAFAASLARGPVTVAYWAGSVGGYTQFVPPGHLGLLYVDPAFGGRGIGRRLVEAVIAQAHVAGVRQLTTDASRVARSVFAGLGFKVDAIEFAERGGERFERFRMSLDFHS